MGFLKLQKTRQYYQRFQVKPRRRRQGKTDYQARRNLIVQDKNKYGVPKYRLVVRLTNKDVICQIVYAKVKGDVTVAAAYSHELPRYGVKLGLTNYAACYSTGLLLARRILTKFKLAEKYTGNTKVSETYLAEREGEEGPRPFKAFLDIGLARTSTGARIFAVLKGAADGGILVPHSEKRFIGFKDGQLNRELLKKYIYGGHVADYMRKLKEENAEAYQKQFSRYIKEGIAADNIEGIYKKAHEQIRAKPESVKKERKEVKPNKHAHKPKRTRAARVNRVKQIKAAMEKKK